MRTLTNSFLTSAFFALTLSACLASGGGKSSEDTQTVSPEEDTGIPGDVSAEDLDDPEPDAKLDDIPFNVLEDTAVVEDAMPIEDVPSPEDIALPPEDTSVPEEVGAVYKTPTFEVEVTEDLVFGQGLANSDWNANDNQPFDLLVDVYRPVRDNPPKMPVVVVIHGGGFTGGTHKHAALSDMAHSFAERGWVAFSIDYRVVKHHGTLPANYPEPPAVGLNEKQINQFYAFYPACRDAKAAIRWIRSKAEEYSLQTDYITAIGGSAGSSIALALGVTNEDDCVSEISVEEDPTLAGTHLEQSSSIRTIIDHWGGTRIVRVLEMMTPGDRFDATDAPISIVHGTEDPTLLFEQAEEIKAEYDKTGVDYAWYPLEGAGHGPWGANVDGKSLSVLAFDFIVEQQSLDVQ